MKKAKQRFDDLTSRIKDGEKVSFGQMEGVFAQAFLSKFLQRLSSEPQRRRANEFYQQHLQDEEQYEDEELPELTTEQRILYELEMARSVIGALGVRPTTEDLSHYVDYSLQNSDWPMLEKVLSLTTEGKLVDGTLESIAVSQLESGRMHSFVELMKQFPEIALAPEHVIPLYEKAMAEGNLNKLKEIKDATTFSIPEEICQSGYESLLAKKVSASVAEMHELKQITGVAPKKTEKIIQILGGLYQRTELVPSAKSSEEEQQNYGYAYGRQKKDAKDPLGHVDKEDLDSLNEMLSIYSDPELSIPLQRSALESMRTDIFEHSYAKSHDKVTAEEVRRLYSLLDAEKKVLQILDVMRLTSVTPEEPVYSRTASALLPEKNTSFLRDLIRIGGKRPDFDQGAVDRAAESFAREGNVPSLEELAELGAKIEDRYVSSAMTKQISYKSSSSYDDFDALNKEVNATLRRFGLKPSAQVSLVKISKLSDILLSNINSAIDNYTVDTYEIEGHKLDPLTPIQGVNLRQHSKFVSNVKSLFRGYISRAKKAKKENPGLILSEGDSVHKVYGTLLEIALAQTKAGDTEYIGLKELTETFGVQSNRQNVKTAVYSYVNRNAHGKRMQTPEGLLSKMNDAGFQITIDEDLHNDIACDLVRNAKNIRLKVEYLGWLTGHRTLQQKIAETARTRAIRDLSDCDLNQYSDLEHIAGQITLSDDEKKTIGERILYKLKYEPAKYLEAAQNIARRTGIKLSANRWDLHTMVEKYFKAGAWNTKPSELANLVNQKIDANQVFDQCIALIHENQIRQATELYRDTGIYPTPDGIRNVLERYNRDSQQVMMDRMRTVYGPNVGSS